MHIIEGILSAPVIATGAAITVAGTAAGLRQMDEERIPVVAVLSSTFFVVSLIHVPVPPTSVHLILNGLLGVILGLAAFPAMLVGLSLQAVMFGFGGWTTLGVNTLNVALPAVLCFYLFNRGIRWAGDATVFALGFTAGALAIVLSYLLLGLSLMASGEEFAPLVGLVGIGHLVTMVIEGLITGSVVVFLRKVRPEVLGPPVPSTDAGAAHA